MFHLKGFPKINTLKSKDLLVGDVQNLAVELTKYLAFYQRKYYAFLLNLFLLLYIFMVRMMKKILTNGLIFES